MRTEGADRDGSKIVSHECLLRTTFPGLDWERPIGYTVDFEPDRPDRHLSTALSSGIRQQSCSSGLVII